MKKEKHHRKPFPVSCSLFYKNAKYRYWDSAEPTSVTESVIVCLSDTYLWINLCFGCLRLIVLSSIKLWVPGVFQQNGECQVTGVEITPFLAGQGRAPSLYQRPCRQDRIILGTIWLDNTQSVLSETRKKKKNRLLPFKYLWPEFGHLWQTLGGFTSVSMFLKRPLKTLTDLLLEFNLSTWFL